MALLTQDLILANQYRPDYDLFPVVKSLSHMSCINSLRLLYLIHKILQKPRVSTKTIRIQITEDLVSYLDLQSGEEDPILAIEFAFFQIVSTPVSRIRRKPNKKRVVSGISWISNYNIEEPSHEITIHLNPDAAGFYPLLESLSVIRPKSFMRLSRSFPNWLYLVLTNASKTGDYWIIEAEEFSRLAMIEDKETYSEGQRINSIPTQLLGVSPSPKYREEERTAKKENRPPHFIPANFTSRGNMPTIREKSELLVNCCNIKTNNAISHFAFSFMESDNNGYPSLESESYKKSPTFEQELEQSKLISLL